MKILQKVLGGGYTLFDSHCINTTNYTGRQQFSAVTASQAAISGKSHTLVLEYRKCKLAGFHVFGLSGKVEC